MGLNRPTQDLRRELLDLSRRLESLAGSIASIAKDLPDAEGMKLLGLLANVYAEADELEALANEVKQGHVQRLKQ
ncbi:hypothetical protein N5J43_07220 [Pseudomonas nicosulfuronedens]|uniref:hypothetical protein n=1 Tax=Pseudomonas nicosulfuronedens TaxID=2571105 RepID=UPI00244C1671|nr:hypothetical protein [Pseudomonas nicosulfuronedens]MDH1009316.1 hypothetical protein [Pseudomonas nicosulfuronedens]MDH1978734.1 hypothetical protein [Pseudomonas nicosulfuronedens]MDH2026404.1 hypothetical protein [Pseudomonas nicosulfuronedens]